MSDPAANSLGMIENWGLHRTIGDKVEPDGCTDTAHAWCQGTQGAP